MFAQISQPVLAALSAAEIKGNALVLQGTMERPLYAQVAKVLEAVGGKWNRQAKAHLFSGDAYDALEPLLLTGMVPKVKSVQQEFGAFYSPPSVVDRVLSLAQLEPGQSVLEPSAGRGALAAAALVAGCAVDCVEIDPRSVQVLCSIPFRQVVEGDFLQQAGRSLYDRIIMNPPFAKQADIKHVAHALKFLVAGGRLVSVMSQSVLFRQDGQANRFRDLLAFFNAETEQLPVGSFKASGTDVNTIVVTIQVPA